MTAIRERTVLCLIDLPKKLTSRRNLHAHFAQYGEVKNVSVKKDLKSGMVQFSTHFEAQSAKTQGTLYDGQPLNIFWSEAVSLDPRARDKDSTGSTGSEELWQDDDDKECFGVETVPTKKNVVQLAKTIIKSHLKQPNKRKLSLKLGTNEVKKQEGLTLQETQLSSGNVTGFKKVVSPLKKISSIQLSKRKLLREQMSNQMKSALRDEVLKPSISAPDLAELKRKLALLDERDKLIRKQTVQDSNIKTAVAIKGTCPDMCPEKERLLRQYGHAVATYEMIPGTTEMNENRAVKEYTRSSADQEVPLPHDLRPEPVLSKTMSYMITNIITRVDNEDENKAVWYSFCWNRLRSVRKDIILQQLCDLKTVTIVEQCARFHICCYDHMWGAEVSGFDDKINSHNLMDCLQTLRHLYEDLAKHNLSCPNEPEFYSYLILLKLKSGDVMWEYQQYSLEVQSSPHVRFAIEAYIAFKNNMYSKYFTLVKKAPYLTACLMQRYFNEVRQQAIKIMLRAYCLPGKTVGLSSSFITSTLNFDSQKNALKFCEKEEIDMKLDIDDNEEDVFTTTSSFLIREKRLPIANAVVGENNPLPVFVPYALHSSFDEFGRLKTTLSPDLDEEDLSDKILYSDEDKSDLQSEEIVSEVDMQDLVAKQPTFKFSLSPTKAKENAFAKSFFPLHSTNLNQQNSELTMFYDASSKGLEDSLINSSSVDAFDTIENMDEEMEYENVNKAEETTLSINKQSVNNTLFNNSRSAHLASDQSDSFTPQNPSNLSKAEENGDNKLFYHPTRGIQEKAIHEKTISPFAFTYSQNPSSKPMFGNLNQTSHKMEIYSETLGMPSKPSKLVNQQSVEFKLPHEKETHNKLDTLSFSQIPQPQTLPRVNEFTQNKEISQSLEELEKTNNAILLDKLLKQKDEEERLQMEEMKKLEEEKRRIKIEEQKTLQKLKKNLRERLKAINARKYARQWKERVEQLKRTRADFPRLVPLTVNAHLSKWGTVQSVPYNKVFQRAKDQKNSARVIYQILSSGLTDSCRYISSQLAEVLAQSACKTMKKGSVTPVYWKLGISVPQVASCSPELSVFNQLMKRWCSQSFYKVGDIGSVERVITSLEIPVNISIHFSDSVETYQELQAMDALVFVLLSEAETEKLCLQRLQNLLKCQIKSGEFSVAVMIVNGCKFERVVKMELEELYEQNVVSHWTINEWVSPKSIINSLHDLAKQICAFPHICASPLETLAKQVSEDFFDALSATRYPCKELMNAVKNPNNVIYLYNTCLTKLEDLLMSSKLEKYFNFAEDFKMYVPPNEYGGPELLCGRQYSELYMSQVSKKIKSLKLPEFSNWPPKSPNRLVKMLRTYCSEVHDSSIFPQIVRMLDLSDGEAFADHLGEVSWINIVEIWAQCCLRHIFSSRDKHKKLFVIFNKNNVQQMIQRQWWLKLPIVTNQ